MTRARFGLRLGWLVLLSAACGPPPAKTAAEDTVRLASRALTEARSRGGESTELARAIEDVDEWLVQAEQAVDLWPAGTSHSLAYETVAPCLARALGGLREALVAAGHPVPEALESAEASAAAVTDATCLSRRDRR